MKLNSLLSVISLLSLPISLAASAQIVVSEQQHIDKAYALAGASFMRKTVDLQCTDSVNAMSFFKNSTVPPAKKVFDNLYFVGVSSVSAWALKTSEGIILIDALSNTEEAQKVIESGLLALDLDPAEIKYIVITHGHGDHYGGARYLAEKYDARVLMSESDWDMAINSAARPPKPGAEPPKWSQAPDKDMLAVDGQALTLGDTTVKIVFTPGHTPGTISVVFPVLNQGEQHMAGLWGGTGFPRDLDGLQQYVASADKFLSVLKQEQVDVALSNHPFVDDSLARMGKLKQVQAVNPFVIGTDAVQRFAGVISECAQAALEKGKEASSK